MKVVLSILVFFCLNLENVKAQDLDSLMKFATENSSQFWRIVSANHDFTHEELEFYDSAIRKHSVGQNENINWNRKLVEAYLDQNGKKHLSLRNKAVEWDEYLIDKYKDEYWFRFSELFFDRELTLSREFAKTIEGNENYTASSIIKGDSITYYYRWENNHTLSNRLIDFGNDRNGEENKLLKYRTDPEINQWLDKDINLVPDSIINNLKYDVHNYKLTKFGDFKMHWNNYEKVGQYEKYQVEINDNKSFYNYLIKPNLTDAKLKKIFDLESSKNLYFKDYFNEEGDLGYYPEVKIPSEAYAVARKGNLELFDFDDQVFNLQSAGAYRFCDIILENLGDYNVLLLSDYAYEVFSKFSLPIHRKFKVALKIDHPWYGKFTMDYHLLVYGNKISYKQLDVANSTAIKKLNRRGGFFSKGGGLFSNEIITDLSFKEDLAKYKFDHIKSERELKDCSFTRLALNQYLDLIPTYGLLISSQMLEAIERAGLTGIQFRKPGVTEYIFPSIDPGDQAQSRTAKKIKYKKDNPLKKQKMIEIYYKEKEKIAAYKKKDVKVESILMKRKTNKKDSMAVALLNFQLNNKVVLPETIVAKLLSTNKSKRFKTLGEAKEGWDWIPLDRLEIIFKEWYVFNPQLYNGVCIGENGLGDYVVLLREANSPYKVSNNLAILWHETGDVELLQSELNKAIIE